MVPPHRRAGGGLELGGPWSLLEGSLSQLGGPWSLPRGPQSQLGGPWSQLGGLEPAGRASWEAWSQLGGPAETPGGGTEKKRERTERYQHVVVP